MDVSLEKEVYTCKARGCTASVATPTALCDAHNKPKRPSSTKLDAPHATKKQRTKHPLPSAIDVIPTTPIELPGDASAQKCSYHDCPNRAKVIQTYGVFCNRHAVVFPCGFPGCRDKAPTNGTRCAKHAEQGTAMLDEALAVRSQSIPVCRTKGCFKNDQGRGYCRGHEKLMMATGQLPHAINKRRLNSAYTMCCYPGCNKHSQRNHLCRIHGNELIKQAQQLIDTKQTSLSFEEVLADLQKKLRRCTHPDCEKNAQRDRLCTTHFHLRGQVEKGLDPKTTLSSDAKEKVVKFCSDDKCTQPVYCNWLCQMHYEQREKKGKPSAVKPGKDPPKKLLSSSNPADYLHLSPPLQAAASSSMVDLLYPQKDSLVYPDLTLDDSSFVKKDDVRSNSFFAARNAVNALNRSTQQTSTYGSLSFEYEPSASFLQESSLYASSRTTKCANPACGREVIGKGMCEVCLGVSTHVNFSPTMHPNGTTNGMSGNNNSSYAPSSYAPSSFDAKPVPQADFHWSGGQQPHSSNHQNHHHHHPHNPPQFFYTDSGRDVHQTKQSPYPQPYGTHPSYYDPKATRQCKFGNCRMPTKAPLCLLHASATLCSSPTCEELVVTPGFCPLHTLHNQCAVDGCHMAVMGNNPTTCLTHEHATRCNHTQCFKFALKASSYCELHQQGTMDHCKLCALYDLVCPLVHDHAPTPKDAPTSNHTGLLTPSVQKMAL
ncbi:unnamed protein product [Aphanomyces euteiches]